MVFIFIWWRLPRVLIMNYEQQALELINKVEELEVHNYLLRKALVDLFNGGWDEEHSQLITNQAKIALESTPEQCLDSVKADAINDFVSQVAVMEVKGSKDSAHAEYYKAALRNVFHCGVHEVSKLRGKT